MLVSGSVGTSWNLKNNHPLKINGWLSNGMMNQIVNIGNGSLSGVNSLFVSGRVYNILFWKMKFQFHGWSTGAPPPNATYPPPPEIRA